MRRTSLVLLSLALAGCVNVSINVGQSPSPAAPSVPAATTAPAICDAPGAGSILQIQQSSMEPTLEAGDVLLVVPGAPVLGDIVAFNPPQTWTSDSTPFFKRVIGLPGDTVEVKEDGYVYVNGVNLDEQYLYVNDAGVQEPTTTSPDQSTWVVPAGQLFVMGDHRQKSADSRVFGPISISNVIGIAAWRCGPAATPLRSARG